MDEDDPVAVRRGGGALATAVRVTAVEAEDVPESVEASSEMGGALLLLLVVMLITAEPACIVVPQRDFAASRILPTPFLATLIVLVVVWVSKLLDVESSRNNSELVEWEDVGNIGSILPHRVPPSTF